MEKGENVLGQFKQQGKTVIKQMAKKIKMAILMNPVTYIVLAIVLLIIIIAGVMMDDESTTSSNTGGMSSVSGSTSGTGTSGSSVLVNSELYNSDGTVNEEKILDLQVTLEKQHNLVSADRNLSTGYGNNIGGEYNKENCEKVTGTYLGFKYWDEELPRSNLNGIVYQCPWWANGRASEVYGKKIVIAGNAIDMYPNGAKKYKTGATPKANSMVIYDNNTVYGHVAYVEAVDNVNKYYYISHAGSGKSWFGIQKIPFGSAPWSGYTQKGFVYLDEPI